MWQSVHNVPPAGLLLDDLHSPGACDEDTRVKQQLPRTLTQMYIHFLVVQAKVKSLKYDGRSESDPHWTPETREMVKALGKLAFEQLHKGNLIFYDSDLEECGLDAAAASVYSGVFTQVFREEPGLYQDKVYCFIHLSVQEFLAALHVHLTFYNSGVDLLSAQQSPEKHKSTSHSESEGQSPELFYLSAVDQALESPNGHLDLFLRFLLGLSLPTNQSLLLGLTQTGSSSETNQETIEYISEIMCEDMTPECRMNLLHCLNELNDHSLVEQVQSFMREGHFSDENMFAAQWTAVSFLLLSSDSDLDEFDLRKYNPSGYAFSGLLPVMKASRKVILSGCHLDEYYCDDLASVLSSSSLTHLDLSYNNLTDSGVEELCSGLKSASCRLEVLSLSCCELSHLCCAALASVLSSSSLTHLDLSNNDLEDSGVEQLCSGLKSAPCRLELLSLSCCKLSHLCCAALASVLSSSSLTHLDLSNNDLEDSGVEQLCSGLKSAPCRLEVLRTLSRAPDRSTGPPPLPPGVPQVSSTLPPGVPQVSSTLPPGVPQVSSTLHLESLRKLHCTCVRLSFTHRAVCFRLDPAGQRWMVPGLMKYFCDVTLDPNTANNTLKLSVDKRTVTNVDELQLYPSHQDRFSSCPQVLSSSALTGRCYWEVEVRGEVDIAVSYRGIRRREDADDCRFGHNDQSWSLRRNERGEWSVYHCKRKKDCYNISYTVGMLLDSDAGALFFYEVTSDNFLFHIHTFSCSSSEPLFVGFGLNGPGSSVSLLKLGDMTTET
ncbi:hypothetical protein WMY93_008672 [Mugilogobius chulae]|uniref:B30.2/SPRY domain-containing protein n=1 Tax=Mugilogobius chulae TaxID=88201 RepID=A0AAW0PJN4_9GOBI